MRLYGIEQGLAENVLSPRALPARGAFYAGHSICA